MKKKILAVLIAGLCLLSTNTVFGQCASKDDTAASANQNTQPAELKSYVQEGYTGAENAFKNMMLGYTTKNLDIAMNTIADLDNVVFFGSGDRYILVGKENIKNAFKKDFDSIQDLKIDVPWISVNGKGDVAWLSAIVDMKFKMNGEENKINARQTMVLEKMGKDWKVVNSHFSFPAMEAQASANTQTEQKQTEDQKAE